MGGFVHQQSMYIISSRRWELQLLFDDINSYIFHTLLNIFVPIFEKQEEINYFRYKLRFATIRFVRLALVLMANSSMTWLLSG